MAGLDRRLLRSSRAARTHLSLAVALGLLAALLVLAQAVLLARIIDRVFLDHASAGDIGGELVALVLVVAARALVSWGFEVSGRFGAMRVMSELRARLVEHVLRLRPAGLEGERSGDLAASAVQGVDALDAYFSKYLPQLALAALVPLAVLAWVTHVDFVSAVIMALTVPLIPVFMILIGRLAERSTVKRWRALTLLSGHFLDVVRGLPTLRAFGRAEAQTRTIAAVGDAYRRETMGTLRIAFLSALVLELLAMLGTAVVAVALGVRLVNGDVGFEPALTVLILAPELYLPLRQLGAQFHASADGLAAATEIFDLVDTPAMLVRPALAVPVPDLRRARIRLEGVSFAYPARPELVLDRVDLELVPGECVALVGRSGAGKSTIASLLLRLADPTEGRITVGRRDLREFDPAEWRMRLAWLPQRPHVFSGTVAENVRLADPAASEARVRAAAAAAGLSFGLETVVGAGAKLLSAGEAQRIALARAFLRDAPLLVLDEPTAHLDADSAAAVGEAIARLAAGRTTLLIAHDESVARRADRVARVENGRIVLAPEMLAA